MKANNGSIVATIIVCTVLLGLFAVVIQPDAQAVPTAAEIAALVVMPSVPTAAEIASEINVPSNGVDLSEILEGVYPDEVEELENDVQEALEEEFLDDLKDDIEDLIEDAEGEEIKNLRILDFDYDDDYDFDVINLGLDNEDDRAGKITNTIRVSYRFEDGNSDLNHDKVYAVSTASDWDSDDNEFDDLDLVLTL